MLVSAVVTSLSYESSPGSIPRLSLLFLRSPRQHTSYVSHEKNVLLKISHLQDEFPVKYNMMKPLLGCIKAKYSQSTSTFSWWQIDIHRFRKLVNILQKFLQTSLIFCNNFRSFFRNKSKLWSFNDSPCFFDYNTLTVGFWQNRVLHSSSICEKRLILPTVINSRQNQSLSTNATWIQNPTLFIEKIITSKSIWWISEIILIFIFLRVWSSIEKFEFADYVI